MPLFPPFENPLVQIIVLVAALALIRWAWNGLADDRARRRAEDARFEAESARGSALFLRALDEARATRRAIRLSRRANRGSR